MAQRILIYGATGYMGRLLAQRAADAVKAGITDVSFVLGGRDAKKLAELSARLGLPYRAFALETPAARETRLKQSDRTRQAGSRAIDQPPNQAVDRALADIDVLLNAAGPFSETALPLVRGCLRTQTHYVDISGEEAVFRELKEWDSKARDEAEVALVPGAALTVLGSDTLLRWALIVGRDAGMSEPHAVRVALSRVPSVSRGSARTMLDSVRAGVVIRRAGKAVSVPVGSLVRSFGFGTEADFEQGEARVCTAMTLADSQTIEITARDVLSLSPKFRVCDVETYVEASAIEQLTYEVAGEFALALRSWPLRPSMDYVLGFWPEGPGNDERDASRQQVVVEVEDRYRRSVVARLSTPNSYDFTVSAALTTAVLLTRPHALAGFLSPSQVLKPDNLRDALMDCRGRLTTHGFKRNIVDLPQAWPT
jgi:short subunit dehydrogenase-like uncharacterized protein